MLQIREKREAAITLYMYVIDQELYYVQDKTELFLNLNHSLQAENIRLAANWHDFYFLLRRRSCAVARVSLEPSKRWV